MSTTAERDPDDLMKHHTTVEQKEGVSSFGEDVIRTDGWQKERDALTNQPNANQTSFKRSMKQDGHTGDAHKEMV